MILQLLILNSMHILVITIMLNSLPNDASRIVCYDLTCNIIFSFLGNWISSYIIGYLARLIGCRVNGEKVKRETILFSLFTFSFQFDFSHFSQSIASTISLQIFTSYQSHQQPISKFLPPLGIPSTIILQFLPPSYSINNSITNLPLNICLH